MNQDFVDLLRAFAEHDVRFLVVGAYALGVHGRPRATGDLDVWIDASPANARKVILASSTSAHLSPTSPKLISIVPVSSSRWVYLLDASTS